MSPRISAVTITKNEEKNIERWLHSAKMYADEIIVVDTGSTDNTVAIAQAAGARVERFTWINDFSAAKNYALDLCTGQWIAFLDADEYFPDEDSKKLRSLVEYFSPNPDVVGIVTPLVNIDRDNHDKLISVMHQLRLFRRLPDIKYKGKIHEALTNTSTKGRILKLNETTKIFHTGYSSSVLRQKISRNLDILLSEIAKFGHRPGDYYYLADCYYGLNEYEKAIEYATKHIESGEYIVGDEIQPHRLRISSRIFLSQPVEMILPDIELGIKRFPDSAIFHFLAGYLYYKNRGFTSAAKWLDDGLTLYSTLSNKQRDPLSMITGSSTGESLLPQVYAQRATIFYLSGDYSSAIDYSLKGLKLFRYNQNALYNLLQLLGDLKISAADVIELLYSLYKLSDALLICDAAQPLINHYKNIAQVFAYFSQKENIDNSSPTVLLALGNFPVVVNKSNQALSHSLCMGILAALKQGIPLQGNPLLHLISQDLRKAWALLEKGTAIPESLQASPEVKELLQLIEKY